MSTDSGSPRVGVIGYGFIGQSLVERIINPDSGMELAFVHNRSTQRLGDLHPDVVLSDLSRAVDFEADLIVETAHPTITIEHGPTFLSHGSYMPLSTTALVDDELRAQLVAIARASGNKLYLAAGALIGGDALTMRRQQWREVKITFRKHPDNIDFSESGGRPGTLTGPTVIHEGPVRDVAARFPRNVNSMVTCALMSTGLDRCTAVLIADPDLDCAIAEVEAWGHDGSYVQTIKRQPAVGVSGTEMADSVWLSVRRSLGAVNDEFVLV